MSISIQTNVGGQQHFEADRENSNRLFPRRDLGAQSGIVDLVDQPMTFIMSGGLQGIRAKFQISADRVTWTDWKIHGKQVELSNEHPLQWINFAGHYRLVLTDANDSIAQLALQPTVVYYASTTTHERNWALVGSNARTNVLETDDQLNITGIFRIRSIVDGVPSEWITVPLPACAAIGN
jgi:hypothetical protein